MGREGREVVSLVTDRGRKAFLGFSKGELELERI